jgi:protocatechuate 3,4-dioxygenase beta subunit
VDVLKNGLNIADGHNILQIIVSSSGSQITGTITDLSGHPAPDATIVMVPEGKLRDRLDKLDIYRVSTSDQNGNFEIHGIIPGMYQAYAWSDMENGAFWDPVFMQRFEQDGSPIEVDKNAHMELNIRTISH